MKAIRAAVILGFSFVSMVAFQNCAGSMDYSQYQQLSSTAAPGTSTEPVHEKPQITAAPMAQSVNLLADVTFQISATGEDLVYQWYKDGKALNGANGTSFRIPSTKLADSGMYEVEVLNDYGSDTAAVALTVTQGATQKPPTVSTKPADLTAFFISTGAISVYNPATQAVANPANSASFSVAASSSAPATYQWYHLDAQGNNPVAINGAKSASYAFTLANANQTGIYRVVVSNAFGSVMAQANLTYQFIDLSNIGPFF